ncbi:MAG: 5-(carboxyamino)imidazole ribonucleotide synthase [Hyphomicrobiales bacterium]|nr:5-(carboxyamino)imidazole ribonucleotide synthase [Hyphomicrobiales bacterium]
MNPRINPGDTIGILGSGQLGRMLAMAAARLGLRTHIYAPDRGPALDVCAQATIASYEDEEALAAFAASVVVVSYEFENVPASTAAFLAARRAVRPGPKALATTQDRLTEKAFLNASGIPTAPFAAVDDLAGLQAAVESLGLPSILKTRRFGYDGKGQVMLRDASDLAQAFEALGMQPAILEGLVPFTREVSVIGARSTQGAFAAWDVCENEHTHHILSRTLVPARLKAETAQAAIDMTGRIAEALDYVGVIAVEMFLVEDTTGGETRERLIVNEIAPRVHNSGHWTIDGSVTSQFEQHVRAICGWPLGSPRAHGRIDMRNLIGADADHWHELLEQPGLCLHLYGKHEARPGRKMGHTTRVLDENEPFTEDPVN